VVRNYSEYGVGKLSPPFSKEDIIDEYDRSSGLENEFEKVKWGSHQSMVNRHKLASDLLPLASGVRWLDIGCGTGSLQKIVCSQYPGVEAVGVDLNVKLIQYAHARNIPGATFLSGDVAEFRSNKFEVISAIGVVQKLNYPLDRFFGFVSRLLSENGCLYLDTKNRNWTAFKNKKLKPEPIHDWFTPGELEKWLNEAGLRIEFVSGYFPATDSLVPVNDSHTILIQAVKYGVNRSDQYRTDC